MRHRKREKRKPKGKGAIVFVGISVLLLLVFLAGWLTVRMIDLSDGLDQVTKTGKPETMPVATATEETPQLIIKKIPAPPAPPPAPVSVKETVVTAQMDTLPAENPPMDDASEKIKVKTFQLPETIPNTKQSREKPAEILSVHPGDDAPPPVETGPATPVTISEQITDKVERYAIQVGAFRVKAFADKRVSLLKSMGFKPFVFSTTDSKGHRWYTVRVGRFEALDKTDATLSMLQKKTGLPMAVMHSESLSPAPKEVKIADKASK
jgi:cell division septation protein DedD